MLSNAYFLANFRFDTAENEPAKYLQIFEKCIFRNCISKNAFFENAFFEIAFSKNAFFENAFFENAFFENAAERARRGPQVELRAVDLHPLLQAELPPLLLRADRLHGR